MSARRLLLVPLAAFVLVACGEQVQTIPVGTAKKSDAQAWQNTDTRFLAAGWTPGDQGSWDAQMARRAQGQNDYAPRQ
jgi:hypothetical protein